MTDVDEDRFRDRVVARLQEAVGDDRVRAEVHLPADRFVDVVVDVPELHTGFAVELEDCPEDCIGGVGQALLYAAALGYQPVVGFPAETADGAVERELSLLGHRVPVVALSV